LAFLFDRILAFSALDPARVAGLGFELSRARRTACKPKMPARSSQLPHVA